MDAEDSAHNILLKFFLVAWYPYLMKAVNI